MRPDLAAEAIRLSRLVVELLPDQPEARGLLALMRLHHSRRDTRVAPNGELVLLDEQNRALWHRDEIKDAVIDLQQTLKLQQPGPYQIQASIAALHAEALVAKDTDWRQIAALYGALLRHQPTAIVQLNAAVACAFAYGFDHGLVWIDRIIESGELKDYYLLPAARAELLRRAGRIKESLAAYDQALSLVRTAPERAHLERRKVEVVRLGGFDVNIDGGPLSAEG